METNRAGQRLTDKYKQLQTKINTYRQRIIEADKNLQRGQKITKPDKVFQRQTKTN